MSEPTRRQIEVAEVVRRHARNHRAAADELGISANAVKSHMTAYALAVGQPELAKGAGKNAPLVGFTERLDAIESRIAGIAGGIDALATATARLADQVAELNARQPILLLAQPTHRRVRDGGIGGRKEREESGL